MNRLQRGGRPLPKEKAKRSSARGTSKPDSFGGQEEHEDDLGLRDRGDGSSGGGFSGREEEEKWQQALAGQGPRKQSETEEKGTLGARSGSGANEVKKKDDFGISRAEAEALRAQAAINAPALKRTPGDPKDAMSVLHNAQDPGLFFQEQGEGQSQEDIPPDLFAAVQKVITSLTGIKGFVRASPGRDDEGAWMIIVTVSRGFTKGSFAQLPAEVDGFRTLLALPFDALPLRRDSL